MGCDEIIQRKFEEKEFEINEVLYSSKGMLVDHIFMIHISCGGCWEDHPENRR